MTGQGENFQQSASIRDISQMRERRSSRSILAKLDTLRGRVPDECVDEMTELAADIVNTISVPSTTKGQKNSMQSRFVPEHDQPALVAAMLNLTAMDFDKAPEYCVALAGAFLEKSKESPSAEFGLKE